MEETKNNITSIKISYIKECKRIVAKIEKENGDVIHRLAPQTCASFKQDADRFLFKILKNEPVSDNIEIITDLVLTSKKIKTHCLNNNFCWKPLSDTELPSIKSNGKALALEEQKNELFEMINNKDIIRLYTDGSDVFNHYGIAAIIPQQNSDDIVLSESFYSKGNLNIHFEIKAISLGLNHIVEKMDYKDKTVKIITDSDKAKAVLIDLQKNKGAQIKYSELYNLMDKLKFNFDVKVVKSHLSEDKTVMSQHHIYNDKVDILCRKVARASYSKNTLKIS